MSKKSYRQAINEALRQEMERDHRVIIMGEDIAGGMGAPGEIDSLKADKDCLQMFRQRVIEAGLLEGAQLDDLDREVKSLIEQAVAEAKAAPPPTEADLLTDVYATY